MNKSVQITYGTGVQRCIRDLQAYRQNAKALSSSEHFIARVSSTMDLPTYPEIRVRLPALPDFLRGNWSGTGSTQPREYN
jgi:hypothetical protein